MRSRTAGGPPAKLPKSGNQAKSPMFSVISRPVAHPRGATFQSRPTGWRAEGMREGGLRLCRRGAGGPPAKLPKSENQAEIPMFSAISHPAARQDAAPPPNARAARSPASAPLPEVRHPAAPWRMWGARIPHAKSAKAAKCAGGEREGRTHAEAQRRRGLAGRFCTKGQKGNKRAAGVQKGVHH